MLETVFFGTPDFAVPTLAAMVDAGYRPRCVVTQPSRPAGRGRRIQPPPVAEWAQQHGLEVLQPKTVRAPAFLDALTAIAPDVAVVVAFGQIFRTPLLTLPAHGCINVHASLLPRWRGAAPIQAAIAHGDRHTGITTMQMGRGLDSGPMLQRATIEIGPDETAPELSKRLATLGGEVLVATLKALERGQLDAQPQDEGCSDPRAAPRESGWRDRLVLARDYALRPMACLHAMAGSPYDAGWAPAQDHRGAAVVGERGRGRASRYGDRPSW